VTAPVVVGFVLALIIAVVAFVCWWSADTDLRDHTERLAVLEAALNLGGQPIAITDPPTEPIAVDTEPMPRIDVAGGARKPVPYKRTPGRHAA